jgi:hypothetical protein
VCKLCTSTCVFSSSCEAYSELTPQTKITALQILYSIKIPNDINTNFFKMFLLNVGNFVNVFVVVVQL